MTTSMKPWLFCWCGAVAAHRYMTGPACPAHTPAALKGRPEPPTPDPERTFYGFLALDEDQQKRVRRDATRLHERIRRGGRPRSSTSRKRGKPGDRFYTADDVDMARVHAAEKRVGQELERRREAGEWPWGGA